MPDTDTGSDEDRLEDSDEDSGFAYTGYSLPKLDSDRAHVHEHRHTHRYGYTTHFHNHIHAYRNDHHARDSDGYGNDYADDTGHENQ